MRVAIALCAAFLGLTVTQPARAGTDAVDGDYHGDSRRTGNFVVPTLTWASAATLHHATTFAGQVTGYVIAQPLHWTPPGASHGYIIVATDQNVVEALDAQTGLVVWQNTLGTPAQAVTALCGTRKRTGITGTPVIDAAAGILYVDANIEVGTSARHVLYGISLVDGKVAPGWPVDVGLALGTLGITFQPDYQGQRAGLTLIGGTLYVGYGGNHGDCGPYHGWVVGVTAATATVFGAWSTTGPHGGVWGQGGVSSDGVSLFVATGNGQKTKGWTDQDAVFRLAPALQHSTDTHDFFYPSNFLTLDHLDQDIGGSAPLPIDVPSMDRATTLPWLMQFGKDGNAYVLDRTNLGGMGGALLVQPVTSGEIITGPATYTQPDGVVVAIAGHGANCPVADPNDAVAVLKVTSQPAPSIATLWCAPLLSNGSPLITTTDGVSNPIVWVASTSGDRMLHAWTADTGTPLFAGSGIKMVGLQHFATVLAAEGRLFVGAGSLVYAFDYTPGL